MYYLLPGCAKWYIYEVEENLIFGRNRTCRPVVFFDFWKKKKDDYGTCRPAATRGTRGWRQSPAQLRQVWSVISGHLVVDKNSLCFQVEKVDMRWDDVHQDHHRVSEQWGENLTFIQSTLSKLFLNQRVSHECWPRLNRQYHSYILTRIHSPKHQMQKHSTLSFWRKIRKTLAWGAARCWPRWWSRSKWRGLDPGNPWWTNIS